MVAQTPFAPTRISTPRKSWLLLTGLVGLMGYLLGLQRYCMQHVMVSQQLQQQSQENTIPEPTFDLRDLILKDIRIVENSIDQYNRYISERAKNYGHIVDVFLANFYVCQHGDPYQVIFDVGANIGQRTDWLFHLYGDQSVFDMEEYWKSHDVKMKTSRLEKPADAFIPKIHVFEPEPSNFQVLEQQAQRYPKGHVILHHAAVADKAGTLALYDGENGSAPGNTQGGLIARGNKIGDVSVVSLDDFIAKNNIGSVQLVKIDVEGFEWEVFKGMEKSIKHGLIDFFLFEYGEKWNQKKGRPNTITLKQAVDLLDSWGFDTFLMGQFNNVKVSGDGYSPGYENVSKFVSMEMFSIHRKHPNYLCIVTGFRGERPSQSIA